jgi:6-phosphogluconolactonase
MSAYVTNQDSDSISQYDVLPGGRLTPKSPPTVAAGDVPQELAVRLNGTNVYVANFGSADVSQYTVGVGGALFPASPATVAAGPGPQGVATNPTAIP